jgi:hypothetical protein
MSDDADRAEELIEIATADAIRNASKPLVPGYQGECELCGEWSGRLVNGACAPCRDRRKLP